MHPQAETIVGMEVWAGADRLRAVTQLCRAWDEALVARQFRIVVVRGPSGSGRTSMLQALYQHCAQNQTYWPEQIRAVTGDPAVDLATADSIFPSQFEPGQALSALYDLRLPEHSPGDDAEQVEAEWTARRPQPPMMRYFWWGLQARPGGFAVLDGEPQLRRHLDNLKQVVLRADTLARTRLKAALDAACLIGSVLPLAAPVAASLNLFTALKDAGEVEDRVAAAFRPQEAALTAARRPLLGEPSQ